MVYTHYAIDLSKDFMICKCPENIVWEVHNLVINKKAGGISLFNFLKIVNGGHHRYIQGPMDVDFLATAVYIMEAPIYLRPGDSLILTACAWVDYVLFSISWGILEQRDP